MIKDKNEEIKKKMVVVEEVVEEPENIEETVEVTEEPKEEIIEVEKPQKSVVDTIEESEEKTNYLWIIIPTALLVGALVGGLITYFSGISSLSSEDATLNPTSSPVAEAEETSEPETKEEFDRSEIKLQVLNGSGISGYAGKAKVYLESLGYKDVEVGNAQSSDFTQTEISLKAEFKDNLDSIIKDLSKDYDVSDTTKTLSTSSKYDFVITLGNK